jgi:hypothetical protein
MPLLPRPKPKPSAETNGKSSLSPDLKELQRDPPMKPRSASGRGNVGGFLQLEELNRELLGEAGLRIYDKMFRTDGDVRQVIMMMCNPIIAGTWYVQPHGAEEAEEDDIKVAKFVEWMLLEFMSPNLHGHLATFLPVLLRAGFAPGEQVWAKVEYEGESRLALKTLGLRLPRTIQRWIQDSDGELEALEQFVPAPSNANPNSVSGNVVMPARDLVYYRLGAEGDNWDGVSMLRPAYKHWKLKDALERVDAVGAEREAVGIPICYPPLSATGEQLETVEDALSSMRTNEQGYIIAPGPFAGDSRDSTQGWRIEILSQANSGRDLHPSLEYHTHKIAASAIAEFMRLGHGGGGGGSRATAQLQSDPFQQAVESVATQVEIELQKLVDRAVVLNFPQAKHAPRIRMSQVLREGISDLSDFCQKLIQVGALIPDQVLENFLRDRAELPPADPEAVKARDDDAVARQGALAAQGKPFGATPADQAAEGGAQATPGGSAAGKGKTSSGAVKATVPRPKPKAAPAKNPSAKSLSRAELDHAPIPSTTDPNYDERFGVLRPWEHNIALADIEDTLDGATPALSGKLRDVMYRHVRHVQSRKGSSPSPPEMVNAINGELSGLCDYGHQTVQQEVGAQMGQTYYSLDAGQYDRPSKAVLKQRAKMAANHISNTLDMICDSADLQHGDQNPAAKQRMIEQHGEHAVRQAANHHAVAAFQKGRHDENQKMLLDANVPTMGVRYTSVLDHNRCLACSDADDGQVRDFDDPVRLENRPPNPHCDSLHSGHNMCRCLETLVVDGNTVGPPAHFPAHLDRNLVPNDPAKTNWVEERGDLPGFIGDIAGDLITERGMSTQEAIATAVSKARKWAAGGDGVKPDTQAKAAAAIAEWDAKRASK